MTALKQTQDYFLDSRVLQSWQALNRQPRPDPVRIVRGRPGQCVQILHGLRSGGLHAEAVAPDVIPQAPTWHSARCLSGARPFYEGLWVLFMPYMD